MKQPLILDKSLLYDPSFPSYAPDLNAQFQPVVPTPTILECVSQKSTVSAHSHGLERLCALIALLPDATACPIPQKYIQAELEGDTPELVDLCDKTILTKLFDPDFNWEPRIEYWKESIGKGIEQLNAMTAQVPLVFKNVKQKGDVTDELYRMIAMGDGALATRIYEDIWKPKLGTNAPAEPGRMMRIRILVMVCGALKWFSKYGQNPQIASDSNVFNEVVDLEIRSLGIAGNGFGCLDKSGRWMFRLLVDVNALFPYVLSGSSRR